MSVCCQGCGEATTNQLGCPKCMQLGRATFFCSQECFRNNWTAHNRLHAVMKAQPRLTTTPSAFFPPEEADGLPNAPDCGAHQSRECPPTSRATCPSSASDGPYDCANSKSHRSDIPVVSSSSDTLWVGPGWGAEVASSFVSGNSEGKGLSTGRPPQSKARPTNSGPAWRHRKNVLDMRIGRVLDEFSASSTRVRPVQDAQRTVEHHPLREALDDQSFKRFFQPPWGRPQRSRRLSNDTLPSVTDPATPVHCRETPDGWCGLLKTAAFDVSHGSCGPSSGSADPRGPPELCKRLGALFYKGFLTVRMMLTHPITSLQIVCFYRRGHSGKCGLVKLVALLTVICLATFLLARRSLSLDSTHFKKENSFGGNALDGRGYSVEDAKMRGYRKAKTGWKFPVLGGTDWKSDIEQQGTPFSVPSNDEDLAATGDTTRDFPDNAPLEGRLREGLVHAERLNLSAGHVTGETQEAGLQINKDAATLGNQTSSWEGDEDATVAGFTGHKVVNHRKNPQMKGGSKLQNPAPQVDNDTEATFKIAGALKETYAQEAQHSRASGQVSKEQDSKAQNLKEQDSKVQDLKEQDSKKQDSKEQDSQEQDLKEQDSQEQDSQEQDSQEQDSKKQVSKKQNSKKEVSKEQDSPKQISQEQDSKKLDSEQQDSKEEDFNEPDSKEEDFNEQDSKEEDFNEQDSKEEDFNEQDSKEKNFSKHRSRNNRSKKIDLRKHDSKKTGLKKHDSKKTDLRKHGSKKTDLRKRGSKNQDSKALKSK